METGHLDSALALGLQRGLDFQGPICVYSWPTVGRPSVRVGLGVINMYRHDERTSSMSAPQLKVSALYYF